jgi:hypothetical protein
MNLNYLNRKDLVVFITFFFAFSAGFSPASFAVSQIQQDTIPRQGVVLKQPVYITSRSGYPETCN